MSAKFSRLNNQNNTSIEIQKKMEELGEKNENPCCKNFSRVKGLILALGGDEESQGNIEVYHSKYKNGFFTMNCLG